MSFEPTANERASLGTARLIPRAGEFRVQTILPMAYLTCVLLALLLGIYVYRLMKKPYASGDSAPAADLHV